MKQHEHDSDEISSTPIPQILGGNETAQPRRAPNRARLFIYEALFVAAFNMLNSWFVAWIFFHRRAIIPVWGGSGVVFNAFPSSFAPAFLITIASTLAFRRPGAWAERYDRILPTQLPAIAKLPAVLWQRALVVGAATSIVTGLITILCFLIVKSTSLDFRQFMETQMVQACILGLVVAPILTARALMEPVRRRPDQNPG